MALLDVDEVEADRLGEAGGLDVMVEKLVQFVVGDQGVVGAGGAAVSRSMMVRGSSSGSCWARIGPLVAVAPGVGELESDEEVGIVAERFAMGLAAAVEHLAQAGGPSGG